MFRETQVVTTGEYKWVCNGVIPVLFFLHLTIVFEMFALAIY